MRTLLRIFSPILKVLLHVTLLTMVLTWTTIQYPINITYILKFFTIKCLIPPTDAELMGRHRPTREKHTSLLIGDFPKENIILVHYMLSAWWLHLLDGLGHYIIWSVAIACILMMNNNTMTLCYTYAKRRLKNLLGIFFQIAHIIRLILWIY